MYKAYIKATNSIRAVRSLHFSKEGKVESISIYSEKLRILDLDEFKLLRDTTFPDKTGTELIEEDVVKNHSGDLFKITWNKENYHFDLLDKDGWSHWNLSQYTSEEFVKVGNINTDPDLMKLSEVNMDV